MSRKKLLTKKFLVGSVLGAILSAAIISGWTVDIWHGDDQDADSTTVSQGISEREGANSGTEHGDRGEGNESSGREGAEGTGETGNESAGGGSEEGSGANTLAPDESFDMVRGGARLILNYDAQINGFKGAVENTTNGVLDRVRIEVHLSNGTELGPTTPIDMAPGEVVAITLPATTASFTGWIAHAEIGGGEGGAEIDEAAMSSPITPLGQSWNGVLGGLAVSARYDAATQSVNATVQNTLSQKLCYVQAEPHLKSGTKTVGELGPDKLGDLNPGQQATSSLTVASEPKLAGVAYDGYVVHMEMFDCAGPGPVPHTGGEGAEGDGGSGGESGGEHGGERESGGGESGRESGGEHGSGGERRGGG